MSNRPNLAGGNHAMAGLAHDSTSLVRVMVTVDGPRLAS